MAVEKIKSNKLLVTNNYSTSTIRLVDFLNFLLVNFFFVFFLALYKAYGIG